MMGELSWGGVLFPPLLLSAAAAIGGVSLLRRVLRWSGLYRLVWHPALFDLALFVLLLAGFERVISGR